MADVGQEVRANSGGMQIQITLAAVEPPAGTMRVVSASVPAPSKENQDELAFAGWLGMLRALSDLISSASAPS